MNAAYTDLPQLLNRRPELAGIGIAAHVQALGVSAA